MPIKYIILFLIIIFFLFLIHDHQIFEGWQDYVLFPYNYVLTGRDPTYFYRRDRYRRPYRDGFRFYQSYPYPHLRYNL